MPSYLAGINEPMRLLAIGFIVCLTGCAGTLMAAGPVWSTQPERETDEERAMTHYMAALVYQRTGNAEQAVEELRAASELSPESSWLQERLLLEYFRLGDYDNAAEMARRAIERDPDNVVLHIWLGQIYFQLEDFELATQEFERAIELEPDRTIGYEALEKVEEESHDVVGLLEVYERLAELRPDSAILQYRIGLNLARINDTEGARDALQRALHLDPDMAAAQFLLGVVLQDLDEHKAAIELFEKFLQSNPDNRRARVNLAGSKAQLRRYADAIDDFSALIDADPSEADPYIFRMYLWLKSEVLKDAANAKAPSDAPLIGTVLEALLRKQVGEPYVEVLGSLDQIDSDIDYEVGAHLFDLLSLFGNEETGAFLGEEVGALREEGVQSKTLDWFYGRLLMATERYGDATRVMEGIARTYGEDEALLYHLASAYEELKQRDKVEEKLRESLKLNPNDPDIMNFLGYMFAEENKNLDEAQQLIERALEIDPGNGFYLDSLGWVYYRKGDAQMAVDLIRQAIRSEDMSNDDAVLRDHLGDAYFLNGQLPEAIREWRKALRLDPEIEGVQEKIDRHLRSLRE